MFLKLTRIGELHFASITEEPQGSNSLGSGLLVRCCLLLRVPFCIGQPLLLDPSLVHLDLFGGNLLGRKKNIEHTLGALEEASVAAKAVVFEDVERPGADTNQTVVLRARLHGPQQSRESSFDAEENDAKRSVEP